MIFCFKKVTLRASSQPNQSWAKASRAVKRSVITARLLPLPDGATVLPKLAFSCWREPVLRAALERAGRRQVVVAGMETHVCVLQTALDLQEAGFAVHLAADASGSRRVEDRALGQARLRDRGVAVVTAEMVVFEWLERAEGPAFKTLIPAIKALGTTDPGAARGRD